jgi:hypothetical protein
MNARRLKPTTDVAIKRARGVLKRKPGEKPFRQSWAEYKKEEKALEEAKYSRLRPRQRPPIKSSAG